MDLKKFFIKCHLIEYYFQRIDIMGSIFIKKLNLLKRPYLSIKSLLTSNMRIIMIIIIPVNPHLVSFCNNCELQNS